jgi:hypothetical protein
MPLYKTKPRQPERAEQATQHALTLRLAATPSTCSGVAGFASSWVPKTSRSICSLYTLHDIKGGGGADGAMAPGRRYATRPCA